jgi:hypothetical protein
MVQISQSVEPGPLDPGGDVFTLLGVRGDGIASIVDLMAAEDLRTVRSRAQWLLKEHASCRVVEVWRGAALVEELGRAGPTP